MSVRRRVIVLVPVVLVTLALTGCDEQSAGSAGPGTGGGAGFFGYLDRQAEESEGYTAAPVRGGSTTFEVTCDLEGTPEAYWPPEAEAKAWRECARMVDTAEAIEGRLREQFGPDWSNPR